MTGAEQERVVDPERVIVAYTGPYPVTFSGTTTAMVVSNTSFSGSITISGTITPGGITVENASTINGEIVDNGVIAGGIIVADTKSSIRADSGHVEA
jgi:hypothetical protein